MKQICLPLRSLSHSLDVGCVCVLSADASSHSPANHSEHLTPKCGNMQLGWMKTAELQWGCEPGCAEVISGRWRCAGGRAAVRVPVNGAELWGLWMLLPGSAGLALPTITSARPDGEETLTWTPFVRVQSVCAAHAQSSSRCCWIIHTRACTRTALARGTADSDVTRTL